MRSHPTLHLTGPLRIARQDGPIAGMSRRGQAMLASLACQPGRRAERLGPLEPFLHQITFGRAATHHRWSADPGPGLAMIEEGLRRHPAVLWPLRPFAVAPVRPGDRAEAQAAVRRLLDALPHLTIRYLRAGLPEG